MKTTSKGSSHTFSKLSLQGTTRNVNISVKRHICYLDLPYPWMPETSFPSLMFQCPKWISLERPLNPVVHQNSPPQKKCHFARHPKYRCLYPINISNVPIYKSLYPHIYQYVCCIYIYTHTSTYVYI